MSHQACSAQTLLSDDVHRERRYSDDGADNRGQGTKNKEQKRDSKQQCADSRQQTAGSRQQTDLNKGEHCEDVVCIGNAEKTAGSRQQRGERREEKSRRTLTNVKTVRMLSVSVAQVKWG
jgi:hypothetical protein